MQELLAERSSLKVRLVAKVYPLMEICQRVLTTHPQYLLNCMDQFVYAADVIMPALERLDAKSLNLVSLERSQIRVFNGRFVA